MRQAWIVSVSTSNDNPLIFGPYSRAKAEEIAASFNRSAEKRPDDEQNYDFLLATAYPIRGEGITEIRRQFDLKR